VLALGQDADLSVLAEVPGVTFSDHVVEVGQDLMTGYPGIFAGGDMVPAERTVTVAIGHGKKAARNIDAWLRQDHRYAVPAPARHRRAPQHLVLRRRPGLGAADAPGRQADHQLRRGGRRPKWVNPLIRRGCVVGFVSETGEVDGAGGVEGFLGGAHRGSGEQDCVLVTSPGGGVDREPEGMG
jgi:hypothetical protein